LILLIGVAGIGMAVPACAGLTATRCDTHGCVHIHCNITGDRCYRYADGGSVSRFKDHFFWRSGASGHLRRLCDSDGDRCYPSDGPRWSFRDYYRLLGYRWGDADH
jgi:hypothetical protein